MHHVLDVVVFLKPLNYQLKHGSKGTVNLTAMPKLKSSNTVSARTRPGSWLHPALVLIGQKFLGRFDLTVDRPIRQNCLATFNPARVCSNVSSRSISARLAITWKKNRLDGVLVSMALVRLLNLMHCLCNFPTR